MDATLGPVLIVEDDASIRQLLREALEQEGLECVVAADGAEALRCAEERRPAVLVLDLGLPLVDGVDVADGIRGRYGGEVPVIVVSASRKVEELASRIRALAYVGKPFDIGDLIGAVRRAIEPPTDTGQVIEGPAPSPAS